MGNYWEGRKDERLDDGEDLPTALGAHILGQILLGIHICLLFHITLFLKIIVSILWA